MRTPGVQAVGPSVPRGAGHVHQTYNIPGGARRSVFAYITDWEICIAFTLGPLLQAFQESQQPATQVASYGQTLRVTKRYQQSLGADSFLYFFLVTYRLRGRQKARGSGKAASNYKLYVAPRKTEDPFLLENVKCPCILNAKSTLAPTKYSTSCPTAAPLSLLQWPNPPKSHPKCSNLAVAKNTV